jgi:ketosteroid isomerase-like protein
MHRKARAITAAGFRFIQNRSIFVCMRYIFISFVLITLIVSAVSAQSDPETAIRKVMTDQAAAWNRGDIEEFMQGYWNSDKLVFVSTGVTRGWQPTLERYKKTYDTREKMGTLTFSDLEVTVLSKDTAVVLGSWALARANDNPKGKFTLIFRKFKDGWKIVHDHTS